MHETEELPLSIDLAASAQREAIKAFVVPQIRKHWFDRRESSPVLFASTR